MGAATYPARLFWALAVVAGAAGLALGLALFRSPSPPASAPPGPPKVTLGLGSPAGEPADPIFREDAEAHDPMPLFLPTKWNSAQKDAPHREPSAAFDSFGPKLTFSEAELALNLPPPVAVPAGPADALDTNPPGHPFLGLGQTDGAPSALAPRSAYVEIVAVGTGLRVFAQALSGLQPKIADAPPEGGAWEFMAAVDAAGLVGSLVPTVRSGTAADGYFLDYLAQTLRVGERLPPGFYRISIGP